MDIAGKRVMVTGAASGLGKSTAEALHALGGEIVLVDLPTSAGSEVAASLGERAHFAPADVTTEDDVSKALDVANETPLYAVVHCAGIAPPGRILGRSGVLDLERFRAVIDVNLIGTFNVLRLAAQRMASNEPVDGDRGVVIMTASIAAFDGQIGQAAYSSSKAAVHGLTLTAARDLAEHHIRVCSIAPGIFETPMLLGLPQAAQDSLGAQIPHPSRLGKPSEFAALAAHIISNPMLNGETIRLDGAIRMPPR
ncbi:SDR family NAD(P)-dependent oxidoreductase [Nocardioides astragali]|uniref:SDR family NAD(P)-dependent oxidoreductase n=1 Tax=Nocardioides astragali TaxID=1776736 RepID=A0ABW2N956_9ACTN|nr:SDR family NAD(P)-dependent oxidoreductase [Nocardioides astragali]